MSKGLQGGKSLKNFGNYDAFYWYDFIKQIETKYFSVHVVLGSLFKAVLSFKYPVGVTRL
ncbi:MAG TPA: hypothetical protein DCO83_14360 [Mucilaginibacter sp.]|jgi:hypothetical protein|nr:hypothetical protein [Mucilaginibacter sp.]